jgi:hypothetical protein
MHRRIVRRRIQMHCPQPKQPGLCNCLVDQPPSKVLPAHFGCHHDVQDIESFVRNLREQPFHRVVGRSHLLDRIWVKNSHLPLRRGCKALR